MVLCQINRKLLLIKLHYFVSLAAYASINPFLPTILRQRGYSSVIVGWVYTTLPIPSLLLKPLVGGITDKYKCRKQAIVLNAIFVALLLCAMMLTPGTVGTESQLEDADVIRSLSFWTFSTAVLLYQTGMLVRGVLADTVCVELLGKNSHAYGRQRLWGAVGYGTFSIVTGFCVDWLSEGQKYKNYTPTFIIALILQILDIIVLAKIEIVQNSDTTAVVSNVKNMLKKVKVLAFLFWGMSFGFLYAFIWLYVFWYLEDLSNIYHPEMKPWIKTIQGLTLTIQCFGGEIPFFFISNIIIERVGHMNVFSLTFLLFALRFFLYSVIRNPVWVLPVETLSGPMFALTYSAIISYAAHLAPPGAEGTLQGVVGTILFGIGPPIGSFVGGYLFKRFGSIVSFKLLSGVALAICILQVTVNQSINRLSKNENADEKSRKATILYSSVQSKNEVDENV